MMKIFCKNIELLLVVNYFPKKLHNRCLTGNTPLYCTCLMTHSSPDQFLKNSLPLITQNCFLHSSYKRKDALGKRLDVSFKRKDALGKRLDVFPASVEQICRLNRSKQKDMLLLKLLPQINFWSFFKVSNKNITDMYLEPSRISTMELFLQKQLTAKRR